MQTNPQFNVHYSEEEHVIGTWVDGKTLYEKTISCGALPNNTTKMINHGITNLDTVVGIEGVYYGPGVAGPLPLAYPTVQNSIGVYVLNTQIGIRTGTDYSSYPNSYITLRYIKTV